MIRRLVCAASATVIVLLGLPPLGAAASAKPGCGATITRSTTLTADVGPCTGDGLIVTANHVTLDLAGHRIFGATPESTSFVGVRLRNVSNVTVEGPGSVYRFAAGVAIVGGHGNILQGLDVHDNNSTQFSNDNPDLALFGDGIAVVASSYNLVTHNYVHGNGPFDGIGVFTFVFQGTHGPAPEHNTITNNQVVDNSIPDVCLSNGTYFGGPCVPGEPVFSEDIGIRIEGPQADFNTLSGNSVSGSGRDGISVLNAGGVTPMLDRNTNTMISGNNSSGNGTAVVLTDPVVGKLGGDGVFNRCFAGSSPVGCPTLTTIVGNTVDDNPAHGISLDASQGNVVLANEASGNGFGNQTVYASDPPYTDGFDTNTNPNCDHNTWLGNSFGTVNQPCVRKHVPSAASPSAASVAAVSPSSPVHQPPRPGGRATL